MRALSSTDLNRSPAEYVTAASKGEAFAITVRGQPVAMLGPLKADGDAQPPGALIPTVPGPGAVHGDGSKMQSIVVHWDQKKVQALLNAAFPGRRQTG